MCFQLHFWRLSQHYSCLFYMSACAACLIATTQAHFVLPRFTTFCIPLQPWPLHLLQVPRWETQLRLTRRLHRRWRSLQTPVTKELHPLRPTTSPTTASITPRLATRLTTNRQLSWINEYQTTTTTTLPDNTPYTQFFTALTLEEYQLLSQQQATPLSQLDYTRPIHCTPGDLRVPHYNSTLLSVSLPEAANVHYYHTTSLHTTTGNNTNYVIMQLRTISPLHQRLHFLHDVSTTELLPPNYATSTDHLQGGLRHDYLHRQLQPEE